MVPPSVVLQLGHASMHRQLSQLLSWQATTALLQGCPARKVRSSANLRAAGALVRPHVLQMTRRDQSRSGEGAGLVGDDIIKEQPGSVCLRVCLLIALVLVTYY